MIAKKQFYLEKFRQRTFVVKIGGEVIRSLNILENILRDIREISDQGIHVILVHGGGTQADELSEELGHTPQKVDGRRITEKKDLHIAKMVFGGSLNLDILSIMRKIDMKGIRVSGLDGGLLDVIKRPVKEVDFGFVGDIQKVQPQVLSDLLQHNYIPVVSPLAVTNDGTIVNINADTVAIEIAIATKAEKLILMTRTDGVHDKDGNLISTLDTQQAKEAIQKNVVTDGMAVKIENCIRVIESGIKRVHIINGISPHSLLKEVLTKEGIGTMIISHNEKDAYVAE